MTNIAKAIIQVMKAVKGIDKTMTVGEGKNSYKGVSDQVVKQKIGEEMEKAGLCIIPTSVEAKTHIDRWEGKDWNGNSKMFQSVHVETTTKYLLLHESGESIEIAGYGHGVDPQDKAAGKSTTYALKYALLYTFMVPTGKIDDADNDHSDNKETPPAKKPAEKKPEQPKAPEKPAEDLLIQFTVDIAKEVDACLTRQDMDTLWKKYPALRKNPAFAQAVKDKTDWIDKQKA